MDIGRRRIERAAFRPLLEKVQSIGAQVVRPAAGAVDKEARFPHEAFAALRTERLLGAAIPEALGGLGLPVDEVAQLCTALAQHCAATAMIYAMHQIQLACLARHHGDVPSFRAFLTDAAERQLLVASVTSEVGVGGDMRTSLCAVARDGDGFRLEKKASVISYGEQADALLVTARRGPESPANDQVLLLARREQYRLTRTSTWDTLGMRGTCSPGFVVEIDAPAEQILPVPFADVAPQTMVPYSHLVWSSCWLGIATDAITRARAYVRADARKHVGQAPFGGTRLAEAVGLLQTMRSNIAEAAREYHDVMGSPDGAEQLTNIGYAVRWNSLKVSASELALQIVRQAMSICGMAGYSNESKFSMGRQLRDAYSAALMIANDRINTTNAALLLVYKDEA